MTRRLLNLLIALSLLLCVAAVALWLRSSRVWEAVALATSSGDDVWVTRDWMVRSSDGRLSLCVTTIRISDAATIAQYRPAVDAQTPWRYVSNQPRPLRSFTWWGRHGVVWVSHDETGSTGQRETFRAIHVPFWVIVPMLGAAPSLWLWRRHRRWRRSRAGRCPRCDYDLRATPDRCPECGDEPGR